MSGLGAGHLLRRTSIGLPVLAALLACADGGSNVNQRGVGDSPETGGVGIGLGDIAVSPYGGYVLFARGGELAVGWPERGSVQRLPVANPTRLAFSKKRPVAYVGSDAEIDRIVAVDVAARATLWQVPVDDAGAMRIVSSTDDRYVASSAGRVLTVVDAASGRELFEKAFEEPVVDLRILPDDERALVVTSHRWVARGEDDEPSTLVAVLDLASGATRELDVPNCSDTIAVTPDGARAFLAPTTCHDPIRIEIDVDISVGGGGGYDPVSLIDLEAGGERFVRNLPGFGPVALSPDGTTAVAFADARLLDDSLFDDTARAQALRDSGVRYHIMVLDTDSLRYRFAGVGDDLPRYAMTPDGEVLLVDSSFLADAPVRLFDTASLRFRRITGPAVTLDDFVLTSDSTRAFALQGGLFEIDLRAARSRSMRTPFDPRNINIAPDDESLYLRKNDAEVCVYDVETERCTSTLAWAPPRD